MSFNENQNQKCLNDWPCDCNSAKIEQGTEKWVYVEISDDSLSEDLSGEEYLNNGNICFIAIYDDNKIILISSFKEIINYFENYAQLLDKSVQNINNIWGNIRINLPLKGQIFLKDYRISSKKLNSTKKCSGIENSKETIALVEFNSRNVEETKPILETCTTSNNQRSVKSIATKNIEIMKSEKLNIATNNCTSHKKKKLNSETNNSVNVNTLNDCLKNNPDKTYFSEKSKLKKPPVLMKSTVISLSTMSNLNSSAGNCSTIKETIIPSIDISKKEKKINTTKSQIKNKKNKTKEKVLIIKSKSHESEKDDIAPEKLLQIQTKNNKIDNKQNKSITSEEDNSISDDIALLSNTENVPAFIAELMKKKEIKIKSNKVKQEIKIDSKIQNSTEEDEEFVTFSKKRTKASHVIEKNVISSDKLAEQAIDLIIENHLSKGLNYLMKALSLNPTDERHYLNRSYLYLIMSKYKLALADAEHIIRISKNIEYVLIANLRAGQASFGLQEFKQAELYLKEALYLNPSNDHVKRQLIRTQIAYIASIGYSEKTAIRALEKYSSTLEAINYLTESHTILNGIKKKLNIEIAYKNYDDILFSSDEDEESNVRRINKILNYTPGNNLYQNISKLFNGSSRLLLPMNKANDYKKCITNSPKKNTLNAKSNNNNKRIWVGNLNIKITDEMLKQKFKQFGNIISISRPNQLYAFINYTNSKDAAKALVNSADHKIEGIKLTVQSAVTSK